MTIEYPDLADYLAIAAAVTGLDDTTVMKVTKLDLANSALHAPAAGFGDDDFYPDLVDKAAVLIVRLARNHALPDGNKRAAWVALRLSSTSTDGDGNLSRASTTPKLQLSPSPLVNGTKLVQPTGSGPIYARAPHPPNDMAP